LIQLGFTSGEVKNPTETLVIDDLKKKVQNFAELEKKFQSSVTGALATSGSEQGSAAGVANRRQFGTMAMSIVAMLFAGAGVRGGQVVGSSDAHGAEPRDQDKRTGNFNASNWTRHPSKSGDIGT
jgi:hypothetical protein